MGAGSLGPNYTQKVQQFLPVLKKAEEKIQLKEALKQKLDQRSLTDKDWAAIGKQKIL